MRQRIKRACVASSSNYTQSKKVHRDYLKEQHEKNNIILIAIAARPARQKTELELFEEGLKRHIAIFKEKKAMKAMQDFKNIEGMKRNHALKKAIDAQLLSKPLGQKLREYEQYLSSLNRINNV